MKGKVRLTLHGHLWRLARNRERDLHIPFDSRSTIGGLLSSVGVPSEEVMVVLLNGRPARLSTSPHPGDHIEVLPLIEGG